ncbi:FtsJ-like methyltransferase-domain-containing protein [Cantharellus anzutake]|uniref:FtsJ-like methyltransferase-domain-containing protein n=1 Tax=Cantharellus anzutake TaxID=1750568 RepID=UPI001908444A|nr:FtsJ-like methyltransferase-domain-containing protein [Cantharellus anzutake]KAF8338134.1 FtsJ-like methyltransferase-domain-containing protein [Cantharellus anzutake]
MGGTQKKTGKGRLDKYYKLAKEQGYRARSAFKLIQLNKKFQFLGNSKCCIDLCAAPGGWLQVASKYMPANSLIVGVDLVPIKPIPRVMTFTADITTPQCRSLLRDHLKMWKADIILHDGAPNVGTAWVQDAYSQAELVLSSLKLAVDFLIKGGTFVTKVFRSQDYNSLVWVFNQLFTKVEATKPPSSRSVSAEIFVVCSNFLAPTQIDPKFLDPRHVFKDVDTLPPAPDASVSSNKLTPNAISVFKPGTKRRNREGYADGENILFKSATASEYIYSRNVDPITLLGSYNKIEFVSEEEKKWRDGPLMTEELRQCCEDLKVLGKRDFKNLLKWRLQLREEHGLESQNRPEETMEETVAVEEPLDEDAVIDEELERLNVEAATKRKRERRKTNERKAKAVQRMQLNMIAPMDIGQELNDRALSGFEDLNLGAARPNREDAEMFNLEDANALDDDVSGDGLSDQNSDEEQAEETEDEALNTEDEQEKRLARLEGDVDVMYESYLESREARAKSKKYDVWAGIRKDDDDVSSSSGEEDNGKDMDAANDEGGWDAVQRAKAGMDRDSSDGDLGSEGEGEPSVSVKKRKGENGKASLIVRSLDPTPKPSASKISRVWFSQDVFKGIEGDIDNVEGDEDEESNEDVSVVDDKPQSEDGFEIVPQEPDKDELEWDANDEDQDRVKARHIKKYGLTTAAAVTLAQKLVNRETTKTHLINDGFSRYSLNSKEGLPDWFLEDERRHYIPNIPVTKEAVQMLRAKMRALDARPIKKIAEAKARKKMRAVRRYERAAKKAEGLLAQKDSTLTEREKADEVAKLLKRSMAKEKRKQDEVRVVFAKGSAKGLKGRPLVGKKDLRAKKRKEKENKKRKRG